MSLVSLNSTECKITSVISEVNHMLQIVSDKFPRLTTFQAENKQNKKTVVVRSAWLSSVNSG